MAKTTYNSTKGLITESGTGFGYAQSQILTQPSNEVSAAGTAGAETATDNNGIVELTITGGHQDLQLVDGLVPGQEKIIICKSTNGTHNVVLKNIGGGTEYATIAGASFQNEDAHLLVSDGQAWVVLAESH